MPVCFLNGTSVDTITAYLHNFSFNNTTGHAIVGALMPDYDMVQKITIIPRSNGAGGLTFFAPSEARLESGLYSRQYLEAQLAVALGGRLAEELIYGDDGVRSRFKCSKSARILLLIISPIIAVP
jgi:ATP-dependent Zn protease